MAFTPNFAASEPSRAEIDAHAGPLLLEFGAPWCGHCQAAQSLIAEAMLAHGALAHIKIEDGPGRPLGRSFRVKLWPTLILIKNGIEIERLVRPGDLAVLQKSMATLVAT
jgi:thioredoxin 1